MHRQGQIAEVEDLVVGRLHQITPIDTSQILDKRRSTCDEQRMQIDYIVEDPSSIVTGGEEDQHEHDDQGEQAEVVDAQLPRRTRDDLVAGGENTRRNADEDWKGNETNVGVQRQREVHFA